MKKYLLIFLFFLPFYATALFVQGEEPEHFQTEEHQNLSFLLAGDPSDPAHSDLKHLQGWIETGEKESDTFQAKFFHMLLILFLLIAFMFIASWALKRLMKSKLSNMNMGSTIKVIESRSISPRATLHVVAVNNQNFLIAESPTTVTYLAALSKETPGE